jgi:DNA-binding NarL/FixJ family response regulator
LTKAWVLVVEDDPAWQDLFAEIIGDAGFKPVVVDTLVDAAAALAERAFVLAVVDISLSLPDHADRGGVAVLRAIAARSERLPAIVVTGYATVDLAIETLAELNARHFFRKEDFSRRKFIETVQKETGANNPLSVLSEREREVLALMSQGLTNKQIADELTVSVNTVKKHSQNIFTKLQVESRAAAVAAAMGRG